MLKSCPSCGSSFKFSQLHFLPIKNYQIKCQSCDRLFEINPFSYYIIGLIAILVCLLLLISLHILFLKLPISKNLMIVLIVLEILVAIVMIEYGRAYLLVKWITKNDKERSGTGVKN